MSIGHGRECKVSIRERCGGGEGELEKNGLARSGEHCLLGVKSLNYKGL